MDASDTTPTPTPAQVKAAKDAVDKMVLELKKTQEAVKNDKDGLVTLAAATQQLNELSLEAKAENEKDGGKKDESESSGPSPKSVWESFREAVKEIGKFSDNFLASLKNAPITDETRKNISTKLRDYKDLLKETKVELQNQRQKSKKLSKTFENLIFLILPDIEDVKEGLKDLADDAAKQDQIRLWAKENKAQAKEQLEKVSTAMKDESAKKSIKELQGKWQFMSKDLEDLMSQVKKDVDAFKKRMGILIGVTVVVSAVLIAILAGITAGATLSALPALFSGAGLALTLGGLTLVGATVFGIILIAEPDLIQVIEDAKEETTNVINEGLQKIASQADLVETMLSKIYSRWSELNGAVAPSDVAWSAISGPQIKALVENLQTTKASIDQLVDDIKQTEDAIETELDDYTEKVYKPLLRLYQ